MDTTNPLSQVLNDPRMLAVIPTNDPSPVAYLNVFEPGDCWVKIQGCDGCPPDSRHKCCPSCEMATDVACLVQEKKPLACIIFIDPRDCYCWCHQEFRCTAGLQAGQVRRVRDISGVLR